MKGSAYLVFADCGDPTPTSGMANSSTYTFGSVIEITCNAGYVIVGTSTIECQADGTWSGSPTCDPSGITLVTTI